MYVFIGENNMKPQIVVVSYTSGKDLHYLMIQENISTNSIFLKISFFVLSICQCLHEGMSTMCVAGVQRTLKVL